MTKEQLIEKNKQLEAQIAELKTVCDRYAAKAEDSYQRAKQLEEMSSLDVYSRAVKHYGTTSRLLLTMEEMSELTKELCKHTRGRNNTAAITEEMADVEIMLEQLKIVFCNRAGVDYHKAQKLQRLVDRMDGCND